MKLCKFCITFVSDNYINYTYKALLKKGGPYRARRTNTTEFSHSGIDNFLKPTKVLCSPSDPDSGVPPWPASLLLSHLHRLQHHLQLVKNSIFKSIPIGSSSITEYLSLRESLMPPFGASLPPLVRLAKSSFKIPQSKWTVIYCS